jgi:hypothetical protein
MIITNIQPRSQRDEEDEQRRFYWKGCLVRLVSYAGIEAAYVRIELEVTGKDKKVQTARGIVLVSFFPNYKSIDVMIDFDKPIRISPDPNYKFITEVSPVELDEEKIHELMGRSHSVDIEALEFEEMKSRTDTAEAPERC